MFKYKTYIFLSVVILLILSNGVTAYLYLNKKTKIIKETIELVEEKEIVIDEYAEIKGSVINPGVYKITTNERIINLIEKAGGLNKNADTSSINLAEKLSDGKSIKVESKYEVYLKNLQPKPTIETPKLISINTATSTELETLPGIGVATATKILDYKKANGLFKDINDLKNVSGIGDSLFAKIKDLITI